MAMKNGRCRMHGGKSTGPKSVEGRARIAAARTQLGGYTPQARQLFRGCAGILARGKVLLDLVGRDVSDPGEIQRALMAVWKKSPPSNKPGRREAGSRPRGFGAQNPCTVGTGRAARHSAAKNPMRRENRGKHPLPHRETCANTHPWPPCSHRTIPPKTRRRTS
jgi:hypothetical protein